MAVALYCSVFALSRRSHFATFGPYPPESLYLNVLVGNCVID